MQESMDGNGSWAATQRVIAAHGTDNLVLLADGRTPFEVFHDQRFLVPSPSGQVSREITRERARSEAGARTLGRHLRGWPSDGSPSPPAGLDLLS